MLKGRSHSYGFNEKNKMMRKLILPIAFATAAVAVQAKPIDADEAAQTARRIQGFEPEAVAIPSTLRRKLAYSPYVTPAFYLFNNAEANGFVIVSGDDEFPTFIAYSDEHSIDSDRPLPVQLTEYLQIVSQYVAEVQKGNTEAPLRASSKTGTPVVAPLLECYWDQGYPNNELCPMIDGAHAPVGCVATAMAQIMYKWKWPEHGRNEKTYDWGGGRYLSVDFSASTYDWSRIKASDRANSASKKAREAVSRLNFDCGVAATMAYGADGSGTLMEQGYIGMYRYLGYSSSKMKMLYRDCFDGTQDDWNHIVKNQLDKGQPVLYAAHSTTNTGGRDAGHCFVLDGYDSNGFMHVNWGWGGSCNGYYDITLLDPDDTGYTFNTDQRMTIDIVPDYEGNDDAEKTFPIHMAQPLTVSTANVALGGRFVAEISECANLSGATVIYDIGLALCDKYGKLIRMVQENSSKYRNITLPYRSYFQVTSINGIMPTGLADGDYVVRFMTTETGYTNWALPNTVGGTVNNWVPVMVSNGMAYFNEVSSGIANLDNGDKPVASVSYFDLNGRSIKHPTAADGIVVERRTHTDGTVTSVKRRMR